MSTNWIDVLYILSSAATAIGRFNVRGLKSGITLKSTVTTARSSPGRCTAFTEFVAGGQSRSDALSGRVTDFTDTCSPLTVCVLPWARSAADARAIAPAVRKRLLIIGARAFQASGRLERVVRVRQRTPHVRARTVVVTEAFLRRLEVAADDVLERIDRHLRVRIERVEVVDRDEPRLHVPLVVLQPLVGVLNVLRRLIVLAEDP